MEPPKFPTVFTKYPLTLIGNGQPILLPRASQQPDYEAELAVVIGQGGRNIPEAEWEDHVFGYTILNDVSARDVQLATSQWTLGKNFPTFGPMGPWIVSKDEVPDPHQLDISLSINGETLQSSNTRELIFKLPTSHLLHFDHDAPGAGRHYQHRYSGGGGNGPHSAAMAPARGRCGDGDFRYRQFTKPGPRRTLTVPSGWPDSGLFSPAGASITPLGSGTFGERYSPWSG